MIMNSEMQWNEILRLNYFLFSGHVECVKWLLANRANPGLRDSNERTPLDLAVEYQHESCIELLQLMGRLQNLKNIAFYNQNY